MKPLTRIFTLGLAVVSFCIIQSGCKCSDSDGCTDTCDHQGQSRCFEDTIQVCVRSNQSCLSWADSKDCSEEGLSCEIQNGEAVCSTGCADDCEIAGEKTCQRDTIKVYVVRAFRTKPFSAKRQLTGFNISYFTPGSPFSSAALSTA